MSPAVRELITTLHAGAFRYVLCVTGGGASAAGWLLSVPGGSRTVLEVAVPYAEQSLCDFLGFRPESFCSEATAAQMARAALERARWLAPGERVAGVGCTASLRSDRPKKGPHRFHAAVATPQRTVTTSLTLTKEARAREEEEEVVALVLLDCLADAFGVQLRAPIPLLPGEERQCQEQPAGGLAGFLAGAPSSPDVVCIEPDGRVRQGGRPELLLCGSFNPVHDGHWHLSEAGGRRAGKAPAFELAVVNADKPALADEEVRRRAAQFAWKTQLWLTRAPTFSEKARLFPGTVFVVGADTASRIVHPRFYGDSHENMLSALSALRSGGCRFLVAGRVDASQRFATLDDLAIPGEIRDLFEPIPAEEFRFDISSTELRARPAQPPPPQG